IYRFTFFAVVLIYDVSIVNPVDSVVAKLLDRPSLSRSAIAPVLASLMALALALGDKIMLIVARTVVCPLIIALAAGSLYLIPQWDFASFMEAGPKNAGGMVSAMILILPVLVFAFSFVAAISQFVLDMENEYGRNHAKQTRKVIRNAVLLLTVFTMFFVW